MESIDYKIYDCNVSLNLNEQPILLLNIKTEPQEVYEKLKIFDKELTCNFVKFRQQKNNQTITQQQVYLKFSNIEISKSFLNQLKLKEVDLKLEIQKIDFEKVIRGIPRFKFNEELQNEIRSSDSDFTIDQDKVRDYLDQCNGFTNSAYSFLNNKECNLIMSDKMTFVKGFDSHLNLSDFSDSIKEINNNKSNIQDQSINENDLDLTKEIENLIENDEINQYQIKIEQFDKIKNLMCKFSNQLIEEIYSKNKDQQLMIIKQRNKIFVINQQIKLKILDINLNANLICSVNNNQDVQENQIKQSNLNNQMQIQIKEIFQLHYRNIQYDFDMLSKISEQTKPKLKIVQERNDIIFLDYTYHQEIKLQLKYESSINLDSFTKRINLNGKFVEMKFKWEYDFNTAMKYDNGLKRKRSGISTRLSND